MSFSPNSSTIVQRTIDLQYANRKRASSMKWSLVNGVFLLIFAYDLSCKCAGYTSFLHYVEACIAGILAANLIQHALQLLPRYGDPVTLTQKQQRLLGLSDADLDSSFRVTDMKDIKNDSRARTPEPEPLPLSIGARSSPPSPHSPLSNLSAMTPKSSRANYSQSQFSPTSQYNQQSPPSPFDRLSRDEFISDRSTLSDYLKHYEERSLNESQLNDSSTYQQYHQHPVTSTYQVSPLPVDTKPDEGSPTGSPQLWWRLHLDPTRLTQFNLNLRLWIQVTILERLVREMATIDDALAKHGLTDVRIGEVSIDRLRKVAASGVSGVESAAALVPFLEPFSEQRYVVRRIKELSRGGCLSEYRWDGGGSDWDDSKPTDSELLMHLFATYLDGQIGPEGGECRPFSSQHVSLGPAAPALAAGALVLHRASRRPPHYVLVANGDTLELPRGRNNLLHSLLLLLACCARREPPALRRRHLGQAALNMLWIIGR